MSVVDLDEHRPHYAGPARCRSNPEHKWAAVVPVAANPFVLKCPYCPDSVNSGHLLAAGLDSADVQREYEKIIRDMNVGNAFLMTALYQATGGKQGALCVDIEKVPELESEDK